jgi:PAS domain S-box-containing protein
MRHWLSAILRSMADGVMVMDAEGCIRISNRVAQELTGWPEDEAFGCPLSKVFHLVDAKTRVVLNCPAADAIRARRPVHLDQNAVLITRDGQEVRVEGNIAAIVGDSAQLTGSVMVFRRSAGSASVGTGDTSDNGRREWRRDQPESQGPRMGN